MQGKTLHPMLGWFVQHTHYTGCVLPKAPAGFEPATPVLRAGTLTWLS